MENHIIHAGGAKQNPITRHYIENLFSSRSSKSFSHFKKELWKYDRKYNNWRKQESLGWCTPASIYNDKRYYKRGRRYSKKRT